MTTETKEEYSLEKLESMRVKWIKEAMEKKAFKDLYCIAAALGEKILVKQVGWGGQRFVDNGGENEIVLEVFKGSGGWSPIIGDYIEIINYAVHVNAQRVVCFSESNVENLRDPLHPNCWYVPGEWEKKLFSHTPKAKTIFEKAEDATKEAKRKALCARLMIGIEI